MSGDLLNMILAAVTRTADRMDTLEGWLMSIKDEANQIRDGQTSLRIDIMARLDRHEERLTAIRDDITVAMGRTGHVDRLNNNTRDEVRSLSEVVTAMQKQIMRLQTRMDELSR